MFEISRERLFDGSRAWNIKTGEEVDITDYEEDYKQALKLKDSSVYIMENDLMADMFDHNKLIEPVEDSDYDVSDDYETDTLDE